MNAVPPIRREILVDADPDAAFEVFTARLGQWWPLGEHSVHGVRGLDATVSFEKMSVGARIVERTAGHDTVWGTVTRWDPPAAVAFTWHPGYSADRASQVEVTFAAADSGQTLVTLIHTGWEAFADAAGARAEYDEGWPFVLGRYAEHVAGDSAGQDQHTWVALMHRPGPQAPTTGALTEDPRFGEHVAFLGRMREAGYLVLAGPLADADGEGMTILRLPGPGRLGTATRLATEDDVSVASGFLSVTVRPWLVVMRGA
jgi:uncharacterized protein YciI